MDEQDVLAERFEAHRNRLRAVAYQTLGSATEADDAVQEAWVRLSRTDPGPIENLGGWLTTVVARVCLNMLQARRDEPVGMHLPEPTASEAAVSEAGGVDPERDALLEVLDPDVLVRSNGVQVIRGAALIAGRGLTFTRYAQVILPALIDGALGAVNAAHGRPLTLMTFTIADGRIVAIDLIDDPGRIVGADLAILSC